MIKVRRCNAILTIKESAKDRYLDLGYDVIDDQGNVLEHAIPTDFIQLRSAYVTLCNDVSERDAEIKSLKEQLEKKDKELKKARAKTSKSEPKNTK